MIINILTLFPEAFGSVFDSSIVARAQGQGKVKINIVNMRDFAKDNYNSVDDHPFGGGPGMILRVDIVDTALNSLKKAGRKVLLTPQGKQFTQGKAGEFSKLKALTLVCGHYEGFDQRVHNHLVDEEISVGPYVLTGGEIPAMVVVDSVARLLPGVINEESLKNESFSKSQELEASSYLEYPQYTKPREYKGWEVPEILLSGNHKAIEEWRQSSAPKVPSSSSISKPST
ncbi:MAG: tRNA (guanosine(37)-N1)-methyltransferase TrmD [bacterium]